VGQTLLLQFLPVCKKREKKGEEGKRRSKRKIGEVGWESKGKVETKCVSYQH
jgi:carbon monoxide dehydrogenase subunit G